MVGTLWMSVVYAGVGIEDVGSRSTAGRSVDFPLQTAGQQRLLLVGVSIESPIATVDSIHYDGVPLALLESAQGGFGKKRVRNEVWYLQDPPLGEHQVQAELNVNASAVIVGAMSFSSVHRLEPLEAPLVDIGEDNVNLSVLSMPGGLVFNHAAARADKLIEGPNQDSHWKMGNDDLMGSAASKPGQAQTQMDWAADGLVVLIGVNLNPEEPPVPTADTVDTDSPQSTDDLGTELGPTPPDEEQPAGQRASEFPGGGGCDCAFDPVLPANLMPGLVVALLAFRRRGHQLRA